MNRCIHSWLVAAALLVCPCYALADPLTLATEDYPPFNYKVGESLPITGMSTDTLVEMAKRANVEMAPTMVPWARALAMAEKEKNTCVYSTIRTPERESRYKWIGPLISDNLALFARADADITLKTLDDARPYRIGTYNGSLANALLSAQGIDFEDRKSVV